MKKKEQYVEPIMEILCFEAEDIVRTSNVTEVLPIDVDVF